MLSRIDTTVLFAPPDPAGVRNDGVFRKVADSDELELKLAARLGILHERIATASLEAAADPRLKRRTLTNLYNERPTWLKLAHEKLDRAVIAAYTATDVAGEWDEDWAAVWVNTGAGQPLPPDHPMATRRAEVDQKVLANLLRLNHERAG